MCGKFHNPEQNFTTTTSSFSRTFISSGLIGFLFLSGCLAPTKVVTIRVDLNAKPSDSFSAPLRNMKLLSHFGPRSNWYHTGVDLKNKNKEENEVLAARAGEIIKTVRMSGYGNLITIKHDDGFFTRYAHLKKILVKNGMRVERGSVIGIVGATGRASTPHLHFEILTPEQRYMDPEPFLFPPTKSTKSK